MKLLGVVLSLFLTLPAQAYLSSDWDVSMGASSLKYQMPSREIDETVESSTTLEVNYSINNPSMNTAMTLSFMEMAGGGGKQLPFTRIAVGGRYYMFGVNGMRMIVDSSSEAKVWRPTPFVAANLGLSNLSVDNLNASLIDLSLRGGVEIPVMSDLLLIGQVAMGMSLTAPSAEDEDIKYNFMTLYAGLRFVGFD
ncbi:hypothetical protein [Bdellovibrio bacteriovorus]|uniref:hypothetical protein n=1 Tax=Bdellovibrio bacteriovorus TaxID=959 RepID=UPI0035A69A1D